MPDLSELRTLHRDSYPMGNIHHGTPERPDWGTFCVECKQSWPCDISELLDHVAALTATAKAEAWDEAVESAHLHETEHHIGIRHATNPYRADRMTP